jgi:hypothetical protein
MGAKLQILLNKMDVYFLLVSVSMSINAKFPVMFISSGKQTENEKKGGCECLT